ncbi:MAG TPA: zinc-ribbon domain-containing protein [Lactovum miscens]|uniref:zinc ribbon domain-containing protein n=1 Tax=Lactovum miscens TaxID=190387 RepID=UPI002ED8BB12
MTREEWIENFILTNGHEPSEEEITRALESGDFYRVDKEIIAGTDDWVEVSDINGEQTELEKTTSSDKVSKESANNSGKKFCSNCGSELELDANFCTNCGAPQGGNSQTLGNEKNIINAKGLQNSAKKYWFWLKNVLLHPVTSKKEDMSTNNMWVAFGIILALLSFGFAILLGSFLVFFIFVVLGIGFTFLFVWLFGILSNNIMKSQFKFIDIFKIGIQAEILFVPISLLVIIFSILARLTDHSAITSTITNSSGEIVTLSPSYSGNVSSILGFGFFGLVIYALIVFASVAGSGMFLMGIYREITAIPENKIDRYPWFVLAMCAIAFIIFLIIVLIFAAIALSFIHDIVPSMRGGLGY